MREPTPEQERDGYTGLSCIALMVAVVLFGIFALVGLLFLGHS